VTAIADSAELAGAGGSGAPGRGFPLREYREREEVTTSSPRGKTRSEEAVFAAVPGEAMVARRSSRGRC